jgi:hypothetical protein
MKPELITCSNQVQKEAFKFQDKIHFHNGFFHCNFTKVHIKAQTVKKTNSNERDSESCEELHCRIYIN